MQEDFRSRFSLYKEKICELCTRKALQCACSVIEGGTPFEALTRFASRMERWNNGSIKDLKWVVVHAGGNITSVLLQLVTGLMIAIATSRGLALESSFGLDGVLQLPRRADVEFSGMRSEKLSHKDSHAEWLTCANWEMEMEPFHVVDVALDQPPHALLSNPFDGQWLGKTFLGKPVFFLSRFLWVTQPTVLFQLQTLPAQHARGEDWSLLEVFEWLEQMQPKRIIGVNVQLALFPGSYDPDAMLDEDQESKCSRHEHQSRLAKYRHCLGQIVEQTRAEQGASSAMRGPIVVLLITDADEEIEELVPSADNDGLFVIRLLLPRPMHQDMDGVVSRTVLEVELLSLADVVIGTAGSSVSYLAHARGVATAHYPLVREEGFESEAGWWMMSCVRDDCNGCSQARFRRLQTECLQSFRGGRDWQQQASCHGRRASPFQQTLNTTGANATPDSSPLHLEVFLWGHTSPRFELFFRSLLALSCRGQQEARLYLNVSLSHDLDATECFLGEDKGSLMVRTEDDAARILIQGCRGASSAHELLLCVNAADPPLSANQTSIVVLQDPIEWLTEQYHSTTNAEEQTQHGLDTFVRDGVQSAFTEAAAWHSVGERSESLVHVHGDSADRVVQLACRALDTPCHAVEAFADMAWNLSFSVGTSAGMSLTVSHPVRNAVLASWASMLPSSLQHRWYEGHPATGQQHQPRPMLTAVKSAAGEVKVYLRGVPKSGTTYMEQVSQNLLALACVARNGTLRSEGREGACAWRGGGVRINGNFKHYLLEWFGGIERAEDLHELVALKGPAGVAAVCTHGSEGSGMRRTLGHGQRFIVVVRDPIAVLTSSYFWHAKRGQIFPAGLDEYALAGAAEVFTDVAARYCLHSDILVSESVIWFYGEPMLPIERAFAEWMGMHPHDVAMLVATARAASAKEQMVRVGFGVQVHGEQASALVRTTRKFEVSAPVRARIIAQHGHLLPQALFFKFFGAESNPSLPPPLAALPPFHFSSDTPCRRGAGNHMWPAIWFCRDAVGVPQWPLRWEAVGLHEVASRQHDKLSRAVTVGVHMEGPAHRFDPHYGMFSDLVLLDDGVRWGGQCAVELAYGYSYTLELFVTTLRDKRPVLFSERIHLRLDKLFMQPFFLQVAQTRHYSGWEILQMQRMEIHEQLGMSDEDLWRLGY